LDANYRGEGDSGENYRVIFDFLLVIVRTLAAIAAGLVLVLGFVFLIFLGDANARGRPLVSKRFDGLAALVVYLSWFGLLWQFGFSRLILMVACAAALTLCAIYAASYRTAASREIRPAPPHAVGGGAGEEAERRAPSRSEEPVASA
jgi:hypothetical protein